MKNILKIIISFVLLTACGDADPVIFDPITGQTAVGFTENFTSFVVPIEGITVMVGIQSTTLSSSERTFDVSVNEEETTATSQDYSIGGVTIPADSHSGTLAVTFNFDNLVDFVQNSLVIDLNLPDGIAVLSPSTTFSFIKFFDTSTFVCTDIELEILTDDYASETTWEIKDSTGTIVQSGGPYSDGTAGDTLTASFTLPGGDYTFIIYDSFGDGLFDGNTTGTYKLFCSVVTFASGSGNFGSDETTDFTVVE